MAFGYVDHPPLAPVVLALDRWLLGDSLPAIRLLPALCGAATALAAAWMAQRLGAAGFGQILAALCVCVAPVYLGVFSIFSTNCFEVLFWSLTLVLLLELSRSGDARLWWPIGALLGLAVSSKHTSVLLVAAIALAVPITPLRRHLLGRSLWVGAGLALLIVLPNLVWQIQHDWASLEFYRNVDREANVATSALGVLDEQIGSFNPATFPVWASGLFYLLLAARGRPYRLVGWIAVILFAALLLGGRSRPDRIMGIYPVLFAAGAVQLERWFERPRLRWLRYALPACLLAIGIGVAPLLVPVLRPELASRLTRALGEENEIQREVGSALLLLPLAHRMGARELAEDVARACARLDASQRQRAAIVAVDYSAAGALEQLGEGLPPVYSPHVTHYLWGPPPPDRDVIIAVGYEPEQLAPHFERVSVLARSRCPYCMGWRRDVPIALATRPRRPLARSWPELRHYGYSPRKLHLLDPVGADQVR